MSTFASQRIQKTDTPCVSRRPHLSSCGEHANPAPASLPQIVTMQQMLRGKTDVLSLAQGIVHWAPPPDALAAARDAVGLPETSLYGADDGLPELRAALKRKLAAENGIVASEVMVTAGANQAYTNIVLSLMDAGDAGERPGPPEGLRTSRVCATLPSQRCSSGRTTSTT